MDRTRVKICGFTDAKLALEVANLGVDAVGLVFCEKSPRNVDLENAKKIVSSIPPFISVVALFMDEDQFFVNSVLDQLPISLLQFHGSENEPFCASFGLPYIKSVAMGSNPDLRKIENDFASAKGLLLDSNELGKMGGSGKTFDWEMLGYRPSKPIILAGGLNSDNVSLAIKDIAPYAVDVSSGVEKVKGVKDVPLCKKFIEEVKKANYDAKNS